MAEKSAIFLKEGTTREAVEAELVDEIADGHLLDWKAKWRPALVDLLREMKRLGIPSSSWPQSWHWEWDDKAAEIPKLLAFRGFAVTCGGETQGLMRVDLTKSGRAAAHAGKPLVYIDYLETAPWNWAELSRTPRYKGVGSALLAAAMTLSIDEGFSGRIGLHALPQSEDFYRRQLMLDMGPDPAVQNLRYFEMTADAAQAFLK